MAMTSNPPHNGAESASSRHLLQIPMCASLWPCLSPQIMSFSAFSILPCFRNHHMIQLLGGPQWPTVKGRFHCCVNKNIRKGDQPFLVTLDPFDVPKNVLLKWSTGHPIPSIATSEASLEIDNIQGKRGIWFCGAYQGSGFHEDGLKDGIVAAHAWGAWKKLHSSAKPKGNDNFMDRFYSTQFG